MTRPPDEPPESGGMTPQQFEKLLRKELSDPLPGHAPPRERPVPAGVQAELDRMLEGLLGE